MVGKHRGFTIVELLIVIVVIAILAAISIVAYNRIQARALDTHRAHDINTIAKALELYYIDNGKFPTSTGGSTTINPSWSTTTDASWDHLKAQLVPKYLSALPVDPENTDGTSILGSGSGFGYAYFATSNPNNGYCGKGVGQVYILVYRARGTQTNFLDGDCASNPLGPYSTRSNWRVTK